MKNSFRTTTFPDNLKSDFPAGLVLFFVALPLCLGISLASGAPLSAGLIAGILGGLVVSLLSGSPLSVSGPAAGLTAVVAFGIREVGSFEVFLVSVLFAGIIQIVLGLIKAGKAAYSFPGSVVTGMLTAIGIILIVDQLPYVLGFDPEILLPTSLARINLELLFSSFNEAYEELKWAALLIGMVSLLLLYTWKQTALKNLKWVPSALVVLVVGTLINQFFIEFFPEYALGSSYLVNIPTLSGFSNLGNWFIRPNFGGMETTGILKVFSIAFTIALIASVESLLTIEAVDELDPKKRKSPLNRELIAQGIGNTLAGFLGAIPLTAVIVRSTVNVKSGGITRMATVFHGVFLLLSLLYLTAFLNLIPLACVAAILIQVGYKLAKPSIFKANFQAGIKQFTPFLLTIVAILLTNLLTGIILGIVVSVLLTNRSKTYSPMWMDHQENNYVLYLNKDTLAKNQPVLQSKLESVPDGANLMIDGSNSNVINQSILDLLRNYRDEAGSKNISVVYKNIPNLPSGVNSAGSNLYKDSKATTTV